MGKAIENCHRVSFFREAAPYIHHHRGKIFVIAFPSEVIEQPNFRYLIQDIATVAALGSRIVIIHGTRTQINQRLAKAGIQSRFHHNIRITTAEEIALVEEAVGCLRIRIEKQLTRALNQPSIASGGISVCSGAYLTAQPLGIIDGVDYGHTGQIRRIATAAIQQQLDNHNIVLISPLGYSPSGEAYNLDYEQVALTTAKELAHTDKIILFIEQNLQLPRELVADEIEHAPDAPLFLKRMAQLLFYSEIERVHLLNARIDGALLLELYTRDGVGTLIATQQFEQLKAATEENINGILELIRPLEEKGVLIKRSREQLELEIEQFHVIIRDREIIACVALYETADPEVAELACLVVSPQYRGNERGEKLLKHVTQLAKKQGKKRLLVLTTQTADWFRERGFEKGTIEDLPSDKRSLYNHQRNSQILFKRI